MAEQKILVVFYSRSGKTKTIAEKIAQQVNGDPEELIDLKNRKGILGWLKAGRDAVKGYLTELQEPKYNPKHYSVVVVGTPVWAGKMTPALATYLTKYKEELPDVALFTTAGGATSESIVSLVNSLVGKECKAHTGFVAKELKNDELVNEKVKEFTAKLL